MENFVKFLNDQLKVREWDRARLSEKSGVPESTLSMIFSGQRAPGKKTLKAIAGALDIPESELFRHAGMIEQVTIDIKDMERMQEVMSLLSPSERDELIRIGWLKVNLKREQEIKQTIDRNDK